MWYTHVGNIIHLLKNEIQIYATTWVSLENIMLIEISQAQKNNNPTISFRY